MDAAKTQRRNLPLAVTRESTTGGTYIVTGGNGGLGLEAAKHLASLGAAKVIIAVRNSAAGATAKAAIEEATGTTGVVDVWELDLASYESVKNFAKRAEQSLDRVDALIENAGVASGSPATAEGHLLNITVNVLSTMLLGVLMLPMMSAGAKKYSILPHIVIVTSGTSFDVGEAWSQMRDDPIKKADGSAHAMSTYPVSKLMEVLAVREVAKLAPLEKTGVVMNLVDPGLCITDLSRNAPDALKNQIKAMQDLRGRTAEDGSRTLLFGAVAGKASHGCFTESCEIAEDQLPTWITDADGVKSQQTLWAAIAAELNATAPGSVAALSKI